MNELEKLANVYCELHYSDLEPSEFEAKVAEAQLNIGMIIQIVTMVLGLGGKLNREELSQLIMSIVQLVFGQDQPELVQLIVQILPLLLGFFFREV